MKWCNNGQHFVEQEGFGKFTRSPDGLRPNCRDCTRRYMQSYYKTHREELKQRSNERYYSLKDEILADQKIRYQQNRDAILARQKVYNERNRDVILAKKKLDWQRYYGDPVNRQRHRERGQEYHKRKPEMRRAQVVRYRAKSRQAQGFFTPEQWTAKLAYHGHRCYLCCADLQSQTPHIEHRVPLSRGGTNWIANIAPACQPCNLRKGNKTEREYIQWLQLVS